MELAHYNLKTWRDLFFHSLGSPQSPKFGLQMTLIPTAKNHVMHTLKWL